MEVVGEPGVMAAEAAEAEVVEKLEVLAEAEAVP